MNKKDTIRIAFRNFTRRKTRSILTIMGVLIGTAAIVVMVSLGIGMNESFRRQLSRMGSLNVRSELLVFRRGWHGRRLFQGKCAR